MFRLDSAADVGRVVKDSRAFYRSHNLDGFADALPQCFMLDDGGAAALQKALVTGLVTGFAFPPPLAQLESLPKLAEQMAVAPAPGLPSEQQYTIPWLEQLQSLRKAPMRARPEGPYLVLIAAGEYPEETRNMKAGQLDRMFAERGWNSLAASEYLVLQRSAAETHGDHRFDDYIGGATPSGWMWLLDSRVPGGAVMAYWNPSRKRIELGWCKDGNKNARRGAHPTAVVPLLAG